MWCQTEMVYRIFLFFLSMCVHSWAHGHMPVQIYKQPDLLLISCNLHAIFFLMPPPHLVEICDPVSLNEASTLGLTCSSFYHLATYVPGSGPFQSSNHSTNCLLLWSLAGSPRFSSNSPLTLFIPHIVSVHVSQA